MEIQHSKKNINSPLGVEVATNSSRDERSSSNHQLLREKNMKYFKIMYCFDASQVELA